jgi:hypothetical protein
MLVSSWLSLHFFAFTFWQRKCPWHAVVYCIHYWHKFQQTWLIIDNHQLALSGCNEDCLWMVEYNLRSSSLRGFFHHLHTTSVIVSYLTLRLQVLGWCHTPHKYISDCCTGYCSSINSFITDSIEKNKVRCYLFLRDLISFLLCSHRILTYPKFQTSLQWRDLVVST